MIRCDNALHPDRRATWKIQASRNVNIVGGFPWEADLCDECGEVIAAMVDLLKNQEVTEEEIAAKAEDKTHKREEAD